MSFPVQVLWKPRGKYNKSSSSCRFPQGKPLTIIFFKIGHILIIFGSAAPAFKKEESMFLVSEIDLSN